MREPRAHQQLRTLLYRTFRAQPRPLLIEPDRITPAASLWSCARAWTQRFRELGLRRGDRIVLALPPSRANLAATIAALWDGLTLCPVPHTTATGAEELLVAFDARVTLTVAYSYACLTPASNGCPSRSPVTLRQPLHRDTVDVAFILSTSGTSRNNPKRIALSHRNILAQLTSHATALAHPQDATSLSILPWHHAFGLLVDLWPALLNGAAVVTDPSLGKDPRAIIDTARATGTRHISLVPLQVTRIAGHTAGEELLTRLDGGVVGGAPVDQPTAELLRTTRLRPGYGQTEASPGITLGDPGRWAMSLIGSALGCTVELIHDEITVTGPNVCVGTWSADTGLTERDHARPLHTGDLAEQSDLGLVFKGRSDHRFKLANGRMIDAPALERALTRHLPCRATPVITASGDASIAITLLGTETPPPHPLVARATGPASRLVSAIHTIADARCFMTPKGEPDRKAIDVYLRRRQTPHTAAINTAA